MRSLAKGNLGFYWGWSLRTLHSDQYNTPVPLGPNLNNIALLNGRLLAGLRWNHHLSTPVDCRVHACNVGVSNAYVKNLANAGIIPEN